MRRGIDGGRQFGNPGRPEVLGNRRQPPRKKGIHRRRGEPLAFGEKPGPQHRAASGNWRDGRLEAGAERIVGSQRHPLSGRERGFDRGEHRHRIFGRLYLPGAEPAGEQKGTASIAVKQSEMAALATRGHQPGTSTGNGRRSIGDGASTRRSRALLALEIVLEHPVDLGAGQQLVAGLPGEGLKILQRTGIRRQNMQYLTR